MRHVKLSRKSFANKHGVLRLVFRRSNKYINVQLVDDITGKVLDGAFTGSKEFSTLFGGGVARKNAKAAEILAGVFYSRIRVLYRDSKMCFDRGKNRYCGVVKAFADSLRSYGVRF